AHEHEPVVLRGVTYPRDKLVAALGRVLDGLPEKVQETRRFELGRIRGLAFGVIGHRFFPPEVFLEGQGTRQAQLSRESQGPRAVFNALGRPRGSSEAGCEELGRDRPLAEGNLRDYEAGWGPTSPHKRYIEGLAAWGDERKLALSATKSQGGAEPQASPAA